MRLSQVAAATLSFASWVLAGSLFLGEGAPVSAQDATPAPVEISSDSSEVSAEPSAEVVVAGGAASTMPAAGVGPGFASGGTGPLSLGAMVGAGVAAIFALRERFKNR
jgi:hypothetical protein